MTLEEFKRPYTKAELRAKFEQEGLDNQAWDYCTEAYAEADRKAHRQVFND